MKAKIKKFIEGFIITTIFTAIAIFLSQFIIKTLKFLDTVIGTTLTIIIALLIICTVGGFVYSLNNREE